MTFDDRVQALAGLHFTTRQTRFLVTVALHGGYFLRRQYQAFTGLCYGRRVCGFPERLVARGLAARQTYMRNRGFIYTLTAPSLYDAVGQDGQWGRVASPALIARRLMVLDYVLSVPDASWCATAPDKVALFQDRFGVASHHLPQRAFERYTHPKRRRFGPAIEAVTRYFPDRLPIYLAGDPPVVYLVYLVNHTTPRPFERFLLDHAALLDHLPHWVIVAICPPSIDGLPACRVAFDRFVTGEFEPRRQRGCEDIHWYFQARRAVEAGNFDYVPLPDVPRWHELRRRFAGADRDALYARWLADGDAVLPTAASGGALSSGHLVTQQLPFTYSQFGSAPGIW